MNQRRSYYWVGIPYAAAGVAFTAWAIARAEWTWEVGYAIPVLLIGLILDFWSISLPSRLRWSIGSSLFIAALVLAPSSTAPAVGALIGLASGFMDLERERTRPGRMLINAGAPAIAWGMAGLTLEAMRPIQPGPNMELVAGAALAYVTQLGVSLCTMALGVWAVFGAVAASRVPAALALRAPKAMVISIAIACVASVIQLGGPLSIPVASISASALVAIPVVLQRNEDRLRDFARAVMRTVDVEHFKRPAEEHDELCDLAHEAGLRLGLGHQEIHQLQYLSILVSASDHYASKLPRTYEQQLLGRGTGSSVWPLIEGSSVSDLAREELVEAATAVVVYHDWMTSPPALRDGVVPTELETIGISSRVRAAVIGSRGLPRGYRTVMALNPTSTLGALLRRRMKVP